MLGLGTLAKKIFGSSNERVVKGHLKTVEKINALEPAFVALSDDALKAKTQEFRDRLAKGEDVDDLLPEAFATVREAAKRTLGMRHFDVQLIGGMVLHGGGIAEMRTGEGKTLVATLAAYLNALPAKGVHVITVNDYLASRDAAWMGQIYGYLGLSTGVIVHGLDDNQRRAAYAADITYGTNNEFGFDYLRDNMKFSRAQMVQRSFAFAIVDEVDSILIDEARTPLIISGPTEDKSDLYIAVDKVVKQLEADHYEKDEKSHNITLTEKGTEAIEQILMDADLLRSDNLYDYENTAIVHHVNQALRAVNMFQRDKDYIVKDGKIVLIDEFTGRMMDGRRYSEGLHQAIEAKEDVDIMPENQTLASITYQNYFRMYPRLSGMTGTAATEAAEFADIYNLAVVEIPTNVPVQRKDEHDEFYRTAKEKYAAIVKDIEEARAKGQPVLVGTVSIEKSEVLSDFLTEHKVAHNVLNARYHEREAHIVAQAGRLGAVTIATNMAGRGTDIQLGGNLEMRVADETTGDETPEQVEEIRTRIKAEIAEEKAKVLAAGGLYIIGTERHESRRIDNQLRGRGGRQGDPGRSKFFLSLQDDLMRIFGPERMDSILVRLGIQEGEAIIHPWINKAIEKAQGKVEARNYEIRKNVLKFDDVMNDQRKVIYEQRNTVMEAASVSDIVDGMREETVEAIVAGHIPPKSFPDTWDTAGLHAETLRLFNIDLPFAEWAAEDGIDPQIVTERLDKATKEKLAAKAANYGVDTWAQVERSLLLQTIDQDWKEHLQQLDYLRQVISLRAYGQRDPLNEYKTEAFGMFESLLDKIREGTTQLLSLVEIRVQQPEEAAARVAPPELPEMSAHQIDPVTGVDTLAQDQANVPFGDIPRNAPCPCGSGKKFKHCHGDPNVIAAMEAQMQEFLAMLPEGFDPNDPETWVGYPRNAPCPCGSGEKYKACHGKI